MTDGTVRRDEFELLEQRVAALEHEVEGEKLVSRYILEQTRRNGDDLATLKGRVDRMEVKIDQHIAAFGQWRKELDQWRMTLPKLIADVLREVLREQRS